MLNCCFDGIFFFITVVISVASAVDVPLILLDYRSIDLLFVVNYSREELETEKMSY